MVSKPGTDELECVWGQPDEFNGLFSAKVCAVSETDSGTRE